MSPTPHLLRRLPARGPLPRPQAASASPPRWLAKQTPSWQPPSSDGTGLPKVSGRQGRAGSRAAHLRPRRPPGSTHNQRPSLSRCKKVTMASSSPPGLPASPPGLPQVTQQPLGTPGLRPPPWGTQPPQWTRPSPSPTPTRCLDDLTSGPLHIVFFAWKLFLWTLAWLGRVLLVMQVVAQCRLLGKGIH